VTAHRLDTEISPGIFGGRKPSNQADFDVLRAHGIRTIVSLQTFKWHVEPERRLSAKNGIAFENIPIAAAPWGPAEWKVKALFQLLTNPRLRPIYVHCALGRDRTAVLMALYRVYYENCAAQEAWDQMLRRGGFKSRWGMFGFQRYYWNHCKRPDWAQCRVPDQALHEQR